MRVARAQIGASTLKKTQTHLKRVIVPSEVDRAAISRALERILELSEKHLAGEQLSSLARGRPAGYGGAPAARAEVWARKPTASRQPKRVS